MYWDVIAVTPLGGRQLKVRFADGMEGTVTIAQEFCTGVFAPLVEDAELARAAAVHGTVTWPGGLDLAPDTMHAEIARSTERRYRAGQRESAPELRVTEAPLGR